MSRLRFWVVMGLVLCPAAAVMRGQAVPSVAAIRTADGERTWYLAHAAIWRPPDPLAPRDVVDGPAGAFPFTFEQANTPDGLPCAFEEAGRSLGGKSPKFRCRTPDGQKLRLKYWDLDRDEGSREVFATVAAARLMWMLGFYSFPVMPATIRCEHCPENPMEGKGPSATRRYLALVSPETRKPPIVSDDDLDQGWSWREVDAAIRALPPSSERIRQRTHFDALALLGVLVQHGDRKPEQQMLFCDGPLDATGGQVRASNKESDLLALFERPGVRACGAAALTIADSGSTFGGAGLTSSPSTAKMNLHRWRAKPVFKEHPKEECRGSLSVSLAAGESGEPDPLISEEGRQFLLQQLARLTPAHVRALFVAARVDQLPPETAGSDLPADSADAWTTVFYEKVRQIEARTCRSGL